MSSVSSVSGSSNSFYNNKIGGLASGLDTETMIENMTAATRAKIAAQKQDKQILQWEMDALRSISDMLIKFNTTYTSFSNPATNFTSDSFFGKTLITALGTNSKYITATGTSNLADSLSILGVKQMAKNARVNVAEASDKKMESAQIDLSDGAQTDVSTISGRSISVKYGDKRYSLSFSSSKDFASLDDVAKELNSQLDSNDIKVNVEVDGDKLVFKADSGYEGNSFEIVSGTGNILTTLGISEGAKLGGSTSTITSKANPDLTEKQNTLDVLSGKTMTFSYNGTTKEITLPTKEELDAYKQANPGKGNFDALVDLTQQKLDKAFGAGRIEVSNGSGSGDTGTLVFETKNPSTGAADNTSVLKITSAGSGLLGKSGILGMNYGESNRINLNSTIKDSGLFGASNLTPVKDAEGKEIYEISINGETIQFNADDTMSTIMDKINSSDTGVTVSYNETSDSFTITANDSGASGQIDISDTQGNLAEILFGTQQKDPQGNITGYQRAGKTQSDLQAGQDAIISVDFGDGMGPIEISRSSNVFDLDGLKITASGTFGYIDDGSGNLVLDTANQVDNSVTFDAKVDSDKVVDAVKQFVEDYNELIELVNKELTTKRDRDYPPLTEEQKEEMSDEEIELWEEKAKKGMLFNDSDIRMLSNELRTVFSNTDIKALEQAGITISSDWSENGKISFDESKFRAALEEDPEAIQKLFTSEADNSDSTTFNGIITNMSAIYKKYASTTGATKGLLVERAGNSSAPLSLTDNTLLSEMNNIDDIIEMLNDRLQSERERYNKQFTNLEVLISQMNSQSSWLSQQFGGM
ncbi:MAG TPA: flagellar filament capping protein FliD [Candidatus Coprocola pullicola]|nr:flagellar filament capping protein FliD [Candidatus Coprocola pullicola]